MRIKFIKEEMFLFIMSNKEVKKSRTFAIILSILFGTFGLQEFYLGRERRGLLLVIISWTLIPTIIGILQGLKYWKEGDKEFNRKVNKIARDNEREIKL